MTRFRAPGVCVALFLLLLVLPAVVPSRALGQIKAPTVKPVEDPGKNFNADEYFSKTPNNPAAEKAERQLEQIETGWRIGNVVGGPLVVGAIVMILLAAGAWVYIKLTATTDPNKLAASDPWIRARMAQGGGDPPAAPPDSPAEK